MSRSRCVPLVALVALTLPLAARAADPDADPLPAGAKVRLGSARLRSEFGWFSAGTLTPDGKHIATPALIDVTTGRKTGTLADHPAVFSADGKRAASAAGLARVWDYPAGKPQYVTKRQYSNVAVEPVSLSGDGKLLALGASPAGTSDLYTFRTVLVWDVDADKLLTEITPEQNVSVGVRLSPDGKTLATFGTHSDPKRKYGERNPDGWPEQAVQLWNVADGKLLGRATVAGPVARSLAFSPDSSLLALSSGDGLISLRDARTGAEKRQLLGRSFVGFRLAFSTDGKQIAAAASDGRVQRWSVADGKPLGSTESPVVGPPYFYTRDLVFTGPDRAVAWGGFGDVAVVWEVPSGKQLSPAYGHVRQVASVAFTADGKQVVSTGYESGTIRWNAATGERLAPVFVRPQWATNSIPPEVLVLPGAGRAVSARSGTSVFDLTTGLELFRLPAREFSSGSSSATATISRTAHDGTKAFTRLPAIGDEKSVWFDVWDLVGEKKLGEVAVPRFEAGPADLSADGKTLAVLSANGPANCELAGWDVATGKRLAALPVPDAVNVFVAPGANPRALVTTKAGKAVVVDYATGKEVAAFDLGRAAPGPAVFSADGAQLAVAFARDDLRPNPKPADPPSEVRVYSWPKGELRHTFAGHASRVTALAFAPDGKTLATGSADTTVLLWDLTVPPK